MALPSSGSISLGQVNTELGVSATATRSLGETTTRNLFGVSSGAISMSQGYGKANQFAFTISSSVSNANLRTLAVNAGWNQSSKVVATINSGVYVYANATNQVGLTIDGSFPGGVELVNNGYILGQGGNGGGGGGTWDAGESCGLGSGGSGGAGGKALHVATGVTIYNNGTIGGGGGGGGGGGAGRGAGSYSCAGGGSGGGGRTGLTNSSGANAGTVNGAGAGGGGGWFSFPYGSGRGGNGGSGGNWGASGSNGGGGGYVYGASGGSGGGGGACLTGNGYITWGATGTRYGSIS